MLAPLLTAADPVVSSEGSIDPLGMYTIADALGVRLVPGVRERQQHPRFLTATVASLAVCSRFDPEAVAADGVSEPWMVFEWHMVEGLVRSVTENDQLRGLPGHDKVSTAIHSGIPLSASSYLKTALVFGFHGVYRLLANSLRIQQAGRLGEDGFELLDVWRKEQGLTGFHETARGEGYECYRRLIDAVHDGLDRGAIDRSGIWAGWQFFGKHLRPHAIGRKEAGTITKLLMAEAGGHRRSVLEFLTSDEGQQNCRGILAAQRENGTRGERDFHKALLKGSAPELAALLSAIMAYESFARLLQDAFDDCLCCMSAHRAKVSPLVLAKEKHVVRAAQRVPDAFAKAFEALVPIGEATRFQEAFLPLVERTSAEQWVQLLLEHHRRVQAAKPPNGKSPWFERFDDGSFMIRPGYLRDDPGRGDDSYVHAYRLGSLWSFVRDLRLVN